MLKAHVVPEVRAHEVDGKVIVDVKAVSALEPAHGVQLVNYLKATGIGVGLLINFGPKVEVRRRVFG